MLLRASTLAAFAASLAAGGGALSNEMPREPAAALQAWAAAYATNDGPTAASLYTETARLWGSTSREQTLGRAAVAEYFGRVRPGATAISVSFGEYGLTRVSDTVATASGHYTFSRRQADGTERPEPSRFSMTLVREADGVWRIADHHSSRLPPPAR